MLLPYQLHFVPVEAEAGRPLLDPLGLEQAGVCLGHAGHNRLVGGLLGPLGPLPLVQDLVRSQVPALAEDVDVTAAHLGVVVADNVIYGEQATVLGDPGCEEDKEQGIAQLLSQLGSIILDQEPQDRRRE